MPIIEWQNEQYLTFSFTLSKICVYRFVSLAKAVKRISSSFELKNLIMLLSLIFDSPN